MRSDTNTSSSRTLVEKRTRRGQQGPRWAPGRFVSRDYTCLRHRAGRADPWTCSAYQGGWKTGPAVQQVRWSLPYRSWSAVRQNENPWPCPERGRAGGLASTSADWSQRTQLGG